LVTVAGNGGGAGAERRWQRWREIAGGGGEGGRR